MFINAPLLPAHVVLKSTTSSSVSSLSHDFTRIQAANRAEVGHINESIRCMLMRVAVRLQEKRRKYPFFKCVRRIRALNTRMMFAPTSTTTKRHWQTCTCDLKLFFISETHYNINLFVHVMSRCCYCYANGDDRIPLSELTA